MARVSGWRLVVGVVAFCVAGAGVSRAQVTFTTLANFNTTDGWFSQAALTQGADGSFYGTTSFGGVCASCGMVFKITPTGTLTTLHSFCSKKGCLDGESPVGTLLQADNGEIYGATLYGGTNYQDCPNTRCGTIFKISPTGTVAKAYDFCSLANCADGGFPMAGVMQGSNGSLYGTTTDGGANQAGTIFEITPAGKVTPLYSFCSQAGCADGSEVGGSLVQAFNGNLYGATLYEGNVSPACNPNFGCGTIFEMTPTGNFSTLFTFDSTDGATPSGLIQALNGEFYGVTFRGGTGSNCPSDYGGNCGTLFKITSSGKLTTLYNFCSLANCIDGIRPNGPPIQGTDGNFYGTTSAGGANGGGTIFEITPSGALTTLYSFCALTNCADGAAPYGGRGAASGKQRELLRDDVPIRGRRRRDRLQPSYRSRPVRLFHTKSGESRPAVRRPRIRIDRHDERFAERDYDELQGGIRHVAGGYGSHGRDDWLRHRDDSRRNVDQ